MTGEALAAELLKDGNAKREVVLKVGDAWVEVTGVKATMQHRNAVTLRVTNDMGGGKSGVVEYSEENGA